MRVVLANLDSSSVSTLTRTAGKARDWTARRDAAICDARAAGASLREIAVHVGLTHPTVKRILRDGGLS